jgi:hypothetical protein
VITAIGVFLLPLCLWFWRRPAQLLSLVFLCAVFSAAAVVAIGGNGVTPALVPSAMFVGLFCVAASNGAHYPVERSALTLLTPFIVTVCGALVSSILMPRLFAGEVLVWPQKGSVFLTMSLLVPNSGNLTQDFYLLTNALLTVTASLFLTRDGARLGHLLNVYFVSGLVVVFISLWQFAGNTFHLWFPTKFFLSNPGWAELSNQTFGSIIRLSGPFSEPSSLGAYLSASVCAAAWVILNGARGLLPRLVFWLGLGIVLLCTSTTGYATLVLMVLFLLVRSLAVGKPTVRRRLRRWSLVFGALVGLLFVTVPVVAPGVATEVSLIFNSSVNKQQSSSYADRTTADADSIHELEQTYGLGVGWGSNRSSSLLPGLLAAVGIWGVIGFIWFGIGLAVFARRALQISENPELNLVIRGSSAAVLSMVVSALVSGPTISSPDFYLLLAMLTAASARAHFEATPVRPHAEQWMGRTSPVQTQPARAR